MTVVVAPFVLSLVGLGGFFLIPKENSKTIEACKLLYFAGLLAFLFLSHWKSVTL